MTLNLQTLRGRARTALRPAGRLTRTVDSARTAKAALQTLPRTAEAALRIALAILRQQQHLDCKPAGVDH